MIFIFALFALTLSQETSGTCGEKCTWQYDETSKSLSFEVKGHSKMNDYSDMELPEC